MRGLSTRLWILALPALAALAPVFLVGCAEQGMVDTFQTAMDEGSMYRQAAADNTSREWNAFLQKYPDSSRADEARSALNTAYWRETKARDVPATYLDYIQNHSDSPHVNDARGAARRLLLGGKGSVADCQRYLASFADDPDASKLRRILEKARFEAARNSSDPEDVSLFIAQYPGTKEAESLERKRDKEKFKMAEALGTRLAYHWFLHEFPRASEAKTAEKRLAESSPSYDSAAQGVKVGRLIAQMRKTFPDFRWAECWVALSKKIKNERDLFGARAEDMRVQLAAALQSRMAVASADPQDGQFDDISASGASGADSCADFAASVPKSKRKTVLNAIGGLNRLADQRRLLTSLVGDPRADVASAQSLSQTASNFANDAEGKEEEEDTLYGQGSENSDDLKETASVVARDAARRADAALQIARSLSDHPEIQDMTKKIDSQAKLLMLIIAESERFK